MALFEDNYCKLTPEELVIKTFYFPTGKNRVSSNLLRLTVSECLSTSHGHPCPIFPFQSINVKTIRGVYFEEQQLWKHCGKVKGWGMSFSPCWWGCDLRRGCHGKDQSYYNVVIDCGEKTYKGFTVNLLTTFLEELKKVIHPEAIIAGNFPF